MDINFKKGNGLVPVVVQDNSTLLVLMLGYMNEEAFSKTIKEKRVCFYSRSKDRIWTKGETSGNYLELVDIKLDCDQDTLLVKVNPKGPTCHTGNISCFGDESPRGFIYSLESIIKNRVLNRNEKSYTNQLFEKGIDKVAQKLGEEAVELIIEAKNNDNQLFINEAADLMYHFLVLLRAKGMDLNEVEKELKRRNDS